MKFYDGGVQMKPYQLSQTAAFGKRTGMHMKATVANTISYRDGGNKDMGDHVRRRASQLFTIDGRRTKSDLMHKLGVHPFAATGRAAGHSRLTAQPVDELPDFMRDPMRSSIVEKKPSVPLIDICKVQ